MPVMVLLEAKAKPEHVERLKAAAAALFPQTRAYDGCRGITSYLNEDGRTFVFVEFWDTKAHYERYLAWRTETGVIAELVSMLDAPPSIRHFEKVEA